MGNNFFEFHPYEVKLYVTTWGRTIISSIFLYSKLGPMKHFLIRVYSMFGYASWPAGRESV